MMFIDYSSAFNVIVLSKHIVKLEALGLNRALSNWVLDFLTGRPQVVNVGNNTVADPQHKSACSPPFCTLFSHDCVATHASNSIIKFADDTTVIGLITNNHKTAYWEEDSLLGGVWCQENNLSLNVNKTKDMIVDFRKQQREHHPIHINGTAVEKVES
jgi:hypothetical protein